MTDGSPALLLLLSLGLCCPGAQGQKYTMVARFRDSMVTHPKEGQRLELECQPFERDSGISWIRQDKAGTLYFIVFISSLSRTTFDGNEKTSSRFEALRRGNSYLLVVKSFQARDEGTYFCISNFNQMLYFSSGQPAFFPVTTTAAPTTAAPTTRDSQVTKDICLQSTDPETSKEKQLNFFCEIFIWVPLAGACLLLLIALAITIVLCQKTRRRRCRCKRPANGKPNVKPNMPKQHI